MLNFDVIESITLYKSVRKPSPLRPTMLLEFLCFFFLKKLKKIVTVNFKIVIIVFIVALKGFKKKLCLQYA